MKHYLSYIFTRILLTFTIGILFSCQATQNLSKGEQWVSHNYVFIDSKPNHDANITNFMAQSENSRFLGLPIGIYIYNLAPNYSADDYFKWLDTHPKQHHILEKILSEKQVQRLGESFLVSNKIGQQIRKMGEAPVLLNKENVLKNKSSLISYFKNKGYFNVSVKTNIKTIKPKKVTVDYFVRTEKAYIIDSIEQKISATDIDSIYNIYRKGSLIKKGKTFNLTLFAKERERITSLLRNKGVYNFEQSDIHFTIERDTSMLQRDTLIHCITSIANPVRQINDSLVETPYKVHRIGKIQVFVDLLPSNKHTAKDSVTYNGIQFFFKDKITYRPDILSRSISFRPADIYSDTKHSQTLEKLNHLRSFKYPSIEYNPISDKNTKLLADVYLSSLDKFGLELNTDFTRSNIQKYGISLGISLITRNLFKGSETLEFNASYGFGAQQNLGNDPSRRISEIGGDIRLIFPRLLFLPDMGIKTPQTILQFSTHKQTNIGLEHLTYNGLFQYSWFSSQRHKHTIDLVDLEYINNINPNNFFNVYQNTYYKLNNIAKSYSIDNEYLNLDKNLSSDKSTTFIDDVLDGKIAVKSEDFKSVRSINEVMRRITNNDFIWGASYTYLYNNASSLSSNNFYQHRVKGEVAGFIPFFSDNPIFARYGKIEAELIKHWNLSHENTIAFRTFLGIAYPFGGKMDVPFSRSYFGGGFNDNRGWIAYSLGPGSSNSLNDYNEANMKLSANIEYRFPIHKALKGAIFTDIGNIWFVGIPYSYENTQFHGIKSLKDLAIGSGIGLRYDFEFLIFRIDLGVKTYNPALSEQNRWISSFSIKDINLNFGFNYPF